MTKRRLIAYILIIAATAVLLILLYSYRIKISRVITPFFMAIVVAYLVNPLVCRLEDRKVPRKFGVLIVYAFFALALGAATLFFIPRFVNNTRDLINTLPEITSKYQDIFNSIVSTIQSSNWSAEIKNVLYTEIQSGVGMVQNFVADSLKKALETLVEAISMVSNLILAMMIAYYLVTDTGFFRSAAISIMPRKWRNGLICTGREINEVLASFIQGQLLTALIVGALETVGLMIIGLNYSIVFGMIGGISNIIPIFGPYIGGIPAVAVALLDSPMKALWTVLVFVIVQQIDTSYITPKIIEGRVGLHPVTTILAVLAGGEFFGILGMLLAVPVAAIIKIVFKRSVEALV